MMKETVMTKTFDFTPGELRCAMILVAECLAGMGGERPGDLEYDEYTWCSPDTLQAYGFSKHQAAGFWSALQAKGFIFLFDTSKDRGDEWVVQTDGWRYIDTVWDDNQALLEKVA
jgi:hypothetical protein